jgi:hypothetical protein
MSSHPVGLFTNKTTPIGPHTLKGGKRKRCKHRTCRRKSCCKHKKNCKHKRTHRRKRKRQTFMFGGLNQYANTSSGIGQSGYSVGQSYISPSNSALANPAPFSKL